MRIENLFRTVTLPNPSFVGKEVDNPQHPSPSSGLDQLRLEGDEKGCFRGTPHALDQVRIRNCFGKIGTPIPKACLATHLPSESLGFVMKNLGLGRGEWKAISYS